MDEVAPSNPRMVSSRRWIGTFLVVYSAIAFGSMPILTDLAYASGSNPNTVLFLRFFISSILMIIITSVKKIKLPRGRALGASILMGAVGYASQSLLYFSALTVAPVSIVSLVLYLYPSLVTILSLLFLKEHLSLLKLIALILALGGMVLTVQPHGNGNIEGIFLSLLSAIIYSIYIVVGSRVTSYASTMAVSTIVIFSASVVYTIIVAINGVAFPHTTVGWLSILAIAIISTVFAIVAFFVGVEKIGPSNAAILSTIEPVVSVVLAGFLLGERISIVQLIGGSLILISSLLCSIEEGVS